MTTALTPASSPDEALDFLELAAELEVGEVEVDRPTFFRLLKLGIENRWPMQAHTNPRARYRWEPVRATRRLLRLRVLKMFNVKLRSV